MTVRLLALAMLLAACVPKGRYDAALAEQQVLAGDVERLAAASARLEDQVKRLQSELEASESALEETNRKLAEKIAEAGMLQGDIAAMREALKDAELRKARADAALAEYRDLVARFQALIDAGTLEVKVVDGQMLVQLATDVLFPPGSATLSAEGATAVREVAEVLAGIVGRRYQVAGHTDSVPIATERFPSNWQLGAERAISVARLMVEAGLPPERVSAASYADHQPVGTNRTPEGRKANRRIEIVVVPDLSLLPGYEALEALTQGPE